jgi:oligoribonuclease
MSQANDTPATPATPQRPNEMNLVWVDMEMTGLEPETDRIIEVAMVVTDMHLNVLAEGPVLAIHQSDETLDKMDAWNKGTHGRSGLIDRVKASTVSEAQAEAELIAFMRQWVPNGKSPMCGNTIGQDRRFMVKYMPKLEAFFHYRNIDVSKHTALADIIESIEELKYYRENFIKL